MCFSPRLPRKTPFFSKYFEHNEMYFGLSFRLYLSSFFVSFLVEVQTKATNGRQVVEFKMLAPEHGVGPGFAGGARVQHVVQTQFTIIAFLSR